MSLPWESTASSSGSRPWESSSGSSSTKPWESTSDTSGTKPWESTSNTSGTKPWESTAITKKQPWITEKQFNAWFRETFPAIKDDGTSLLNDFGLKDFVLSDFGTIKIPDTAGAIAALLISAASVLGGVALIVVSAGAATPAVAAGWGALAGTVLGVGLSGTINASIGLHNKNFNWESWGSEVGIAAAASLITFPTCFFGGQAITGALLTISTRVTQNVAKSVATTVGGLVGSGVHSGAYVLQCEVDGRPIEPLGLVLSGVGGFFEGTSAAYLGAKLVATKFNRYGAIKTIKLSQGNNNVEVYKLPDDSMEAAALKEIEAGRLVFPGSDSITEMKASNLKRFKDLFGYKTEGSASTGGTVSVYRKSTWTIKGRINVDKIAPRGAKLLADDLQAGHKWVRISSQSRKAQNVLFHNEGKDLLFLEHAGEEGYGAFLTTEADEFANLIKNLKIKGGPPSTFTLLGCDVPQDFALDLQTQLRKMLARKIDVKTLPLVDEETLLVHNVELGTWDYWKKVPDINKFQKDFPDFDGDFFKEAKNPRKPYLSDEKLRMNLRMNLRMSQEEMEELAVNTDFYVKMFDTTTSQGLIEHTVKIDN